MKIVDAIWEKRNLGVSSLEISIDGTDTPEQFLDTLEKIECEYCVVKLSTEAIGFSTLLRECGFVFVETMNHLYHTFDLKPLSGHRKQLAEQITLEKAKDLETVYENIMGGMFNTDRISLDSQFGIEKAAVRYVNWLKDEVARGAIVYRYLYEGNEVGFSAIKELQEGEFSEFLYGVYNPYLGKGISVIMIHKLAEELKTATRVSTDISSNNTPSIKARMNNGFKLDYITYVFVKHNTV